MTLKIKERGFLQNGTGAILQSFALEADVKSLEDAAKDFEKLVTNAKKLGKLRRRGSLDGLIKRVKEVNRFLVLVGVVAPEKRHDGGATMGEIATFQFQGTATIPPRRPELDPAMVDKVLLQTMRAIFYKGLDAQKAFELLGAKLAGEIKLKIKAGIPPELTSREGTPLIDTGQLLGAISHEVHG